MGASHSLTRLVLFDGVCNLCQSSVQFILKHNRKKNIFFSSLQSEYAKRMVQSHAIPSDITTVVYLRGERVFLRSRAALEICRDLSGLYPLLYIFIIVPGPLRDVIYNYIARHRYRWFGKMDACWMPTPELSDRFFN